MVLLILSSHVFSLKLKMQRIYFEAQLSVTSGLVDPFSGFPQKYYIPRVL